MMTFSRLFARNSMCTTIYDMVIFTTGKLSILYYTALTAAKAIIVIKGGHQFSP